MSLPQQPKSSGSGSVTCQCPADKSSRAFCAATNEQLLRDHGRIAEEELRYQQALKPRKRDGKHYAGFAAPSAVATRSQMLSHIMAALKTIEEAMEYV